VTMLEPVERRWGEVARTAGQRARAAWWRLRGANMGEKCRVGRGCLIERPWGLSTGARVQVEHGVHIKIVADAARIELGEASFVGFGTELDVAFELLIGTHVLIAPGCFITDHAHGRRLGDLIDSQGVECRAVRIESDVWVGAHAVILPGVTIGHGAVIGAGAVVTRDVAPGAIVAGAPARPIGKRT
jgi:acetyltransferase-like isoleucine patch superfamily enzyme